MYHTLIHSQVMLVGYAKPIWPSCYEGKVRLVLCVMYRQEAQTPILYVTGPAKIGHVGT